MTIERPSQDDADIFEELLTGRGVFGFEALAAALASESFPMSKEEVYYSIGDAVVGESEEKRHPVRDLLDDIDRESFESPEEVLEGLRAAHQRLH